MTRSAYIYKGDIADYILELDDTKAAAAGLTTATASSTAGNKPTRFKPRRVYLSDSNGKRTHLICNANFAAYMTAAPTTVSIGGVSYHSTGRSGERESFAKLASSAANTSGGGGTAGQAAGGQSGAGTGGTGTGGTAAGVT